MVYGIGCDLCSIARMEKSLLGPHGAVFARRVFGPAEQAALGLPLAEEEGTTGSELREEPEWQRC